MYLKERGGFIVINATKAAELTDISIRTCENNRNAAWASIFCQYGDKWEADILEAIFKRRSFVKIDIFEIRDKINAILSPNEALSSEEIADKITSFFKSFGYKVPHTSDAWFIITVQW